MSGEFMHALTPERIKENRDPGYWTDDTILTYLDRAIAKTPDKIAVIDYNSTTGARNVVTFAELGNHVDRLAMGLAGLGVTKGDVVSVQLPNWWQFHATHLAAMRLGAITNPLVPIFRERELSFMLKHVESKVLVIPRDFRGFDYPKMAEALQRDLPQLEHVLVVGGDAPGTFEALLDTPTSGADALFAQSRPSADDISLFLFTSGTTGEPKCVMHTSNTLYSNIRHYAELLKFDASDVLFMPSTLAHGTGVMFGVMLPIMLGAPIVLQDIWKPEQATDIIASDGVTYVQSSTPFLADLTGIAEKRPRDFDSLRLFVCGGAPIPRVLARRAADALGAHIVSIWGMTECGCATLTRLNDPVERTFETDGRASIGIEVRTVDKNGQPLPPDQEGVLQVRGCSNFVGYFKRPELYAVDADGWFDTGDLARIDSDGYVRITGREKDIIIRGGENIPVAEIENLMYQHPAIVDCAIVAMPDPRLGERCCAFVVTRPGTSVTLAEVQEFLQTHKCSKTYMPERLQILLGMPRTASGKIEKFTLRQLAKNFSVEDR